MLRGAQRRTPALLPLFNVRIDAPSRRSNTTWDRPACSLMDTEGTFVTWPCSPRLISTYNGTKNHEANH
jgi:hypothetical protein